MKISKWVGVVLVSLSSAVAMAEGGISAGGPVHTLYRAVCFVQEDPSQLAQYEIFVGFEDQGGKNDTFIDRDPSSDPRTVEKLVTSQPLTLPGGVERYVAKNFDLLIRVTDQLPGGGGLGGEFTGRIEGKDIVQAPVQCQLFIPGPTGTQ